MLHPPAGLPAIPEVGFGAGGGGRGGASLLCPNEFSTGLKHFQRVIK